MKARTKSVLVLFATLIVGIALGALSAGVVINKRLDKLRELGRPSGFSMYLERVIEPVDEVQRRQIRAVLQATGERLAALRQRHYAEMRAVIDSSRAALDTLLTPEQHERLAQWLERDRRMFRRRPPRGPGERVPPAFQRERKEP
ncbi:hypothetical protein GQ464_016840 [Rhodocaloribacter litoris]|uniref:hypothetical protein n=1 Tax=Rhodocaloribacter litoris TaxID=2558931 RepID=UPI0014232C67|nr:hypothetical protein [Rhodocaloribacter litoris]QXD15052.1 hypothetical protein GQ464_016840 [Rhodocaloribacter litoris]GIV62153.1 MAG: hypothetical protein KatS3mg044_1019 [Rhodothermaceae bacterium]